MPPYTLRKILAAVSMVSIALLSSFGTFLNLPHAYAAISTWQKGAIIMPGSVDDFGNPSMDASLKNLAATGANYATLLIPYYQNSVNDTNIWAGGDTPSDAALTHAIQTAHADGMKVQLTIYPNSLDTTWRAYINPGNRDAWFASYGAILNHYATLAQSLGVEQISIGGELIDMTRDDQNPTNTSHWLALIGDIRARYTGKLTYSAQWADSASAGWVDEKRGIKFWDALDIIGVTEYSTLSSDQTPSVAALEQGWTRAAADIADFTSHHPGKPFIFGEIGYRSVDYAANNPWDWGPKGGANQTAQANAYQAFFDFWNNRADVSGVHFWNWQTDPNAGGAQDSNFTPQNKSAQTVMTQFFGGSGTSTPPVTPPPGTNDFSAAASISPSAPKTGQVTDVTFTVKDTAGAHTNLTIDAEIYNADGERVFQQFYPAQNFDAGQTLTYHLAWRPTQNGTYTLKAGVFKNDWSTTYQWFDHVATFDLSGSTATPSTPTSSINLWWPSNGATVSGVQPFKAMIDGRDVATYTMAWQVDGGAFVAMADDATDYPHKESDVDLSPWTWNGTGPYHLNFVAKDLLGNVIASRTADIFVAH